MRGGPAVCLDSRWETYTYKSGWKRSWRLWASDGQAGSYHFVSQLNMVEYTEPGYLIYIREHSLVAQGFEAKNLELKGNSFPLAESLEAEGESGVTGRASFTVAEGALLAHLFRERRQSPVAWYDQNG